MAEKILLLETSQKVGLVALAEGERVLAEKRLEEARRHARDLTPFAATLLADAGWKARDLDAVFVSRGPGSYTGLRVGMMSAKTLAYATGCALIAVDTFLVLAHQAPADASFVDVFEDAQQGKVYVQRFERDVGGWRATNELRILAWVDWLSETTKVSADRLCVTGPGLKGHEQEISSTITQAPASAWRPRAETLLAVGLLRVRRGERDDPYQVEPLYLRASQAEQQWRK